MAETVEDLRARHEQLTLEAQNAALEHEVELLRTARRAVQTAEISQTRAALMEGGTVLGSNTGFLFDSPGFGGRRGAVQSTIGGDIVHQSMLDDRTEGRNRPFWETETELAEIRGTCRVLLGIDEAAIGVSSNLTNYVVGTGYNYTFAPRDDDTSQQIAASELCTEVFEEFSDRVKWRRIEREFHDRARRDGETILRIDSLGGGYADVRFEEPDALTEPLDKRGATELVRQFAVDWTYGVATDIGNPYRIHGYFFDRTGDQRDWDIVQPQYIVHGKRNVDRCIKRGLSDFYPVWQEFQRAAKVFRNTGEGAALQSAIAWIKEYVPGTTRSQVQSLNTAARSALIQTPTLDNGLRDTNYQRYMPGTILHVPAGTQYKPGPMGAERDTNFVMVADAIVRYAGLRWNMPAFMTTGGADSKTFAGTLVAESPFVKSAESEQVWFAEEYEEVVWKVLAVAIQTMRFRSLGIRSVDELKKLVTIQVKPPRVSTRNRKEELEGNLLLYERKLLSGRSVTTQAEFDYDHEQELIADEPEPISMQMGNPATRPDIMTGEQQNPVQDIGTGNTEQTTESARGMGLLREAIRQMNWATYP